MLVNFIDLDQVRSSLTTSEYFRKIRIIYHSHGYISVCVHFVMKSFYIIESV
jgi:hypothetical protein